MTSRIPAVPDGLEDEGVPPGDTLDSKAATGDAQEGYSMPRDRTSGVDDFGTTEAEEEAGESLDGRLARELPDTTLLETPEHDEPGSDQPFVSGVPGYDVGRLVQSDEGARATTEAELTATSGGLDEGGFTAEESAMHLDPDS